MGLLVSVSLFVCVCVCVYACVGACASLINSSVVFSSSCTVLPFVFLPSLPFSPPPPPLLLYPLSQALLSLYVYVLDSVRSLFLRLFPSLVRLVRTRSCVLGVVLSAQCVDVRSASGIDIVFAAGRGKSLHVSIPLFSGADRGARSGRVSGKGEGQGSRGKGPIYPAFSLRTAANGKGIAQIAQNTSLPNSASRKCTQGCEHGFCKLKRDEASASRFHASL